MFGPIKYRKGYKYQLAGDVSGQTPIKPEKEIDTEFIKMTMDGFLFIKSGYAWDGSSGPTIDTKNQFTPSVVHDSFCQLIRNGYLPQSARHDADHFFYEMLLERKMCKLRAKLWLRGVHIGAKNSPQKPKEVFTAP